MNGPFLLLRATVTFALVGLSIFTKMLGKKRGKAVFAALTLLSALVAITLQLKGV
jgi:hypothetical protein